MRDEPFDKLRTALVEIRASALRQAQGVRGSGDVLEEPLDVDRLAVFSDAVFAIAATLLVLDIRIPPGLDPAEFHRALRGQLAAIVTYALSFAVIGQLWLTHHRIFSYIARVDYVLLGGSLILMGLVAFLPFPVQLLSEYHNQPWAVALYMGTFAVASAMQRLVWVYATARPQLLIRPVAEQVRRRYNLILATMPLGFGVLVPLAFFAHQVAIIIWLVLLPTGIATAVTRRITDRHRVKNRRRSA
jgi:uncharacterized membrane protein